jgi:hypothetical protein
VSTDDARTEVSCSKFLGGKSTGPGVELVAQCLEEAWSRARKTPSLLPASTNSGRTTVVPRQGLVQGRLCRAEICVAAARAIDQVTKEWRWRPGWGNVVEHIVSWHNDGDAGAEASPKLCTRSGASHGDLARGRGTGEIAREVEIGERHR